MFVAHVDDSAPQRPFKGVTHRVLLQPQDVEETALTVLWSEIKAGRSEPVHSHDWQQIYLILQGEGLMFLEDEQRTVKAGDLIFIPGSAPHGIDNPTDELLRYVSASVPAWDFPDLEALGYERFED